MAKRKLFKKRSSSRRKGSKVELFQIDSVAYGAVRAKVSNMLMPIIGKIPLGSVADEVGMGAVDYLIAKNTSGLLKNIAMKGLVIENARLGEALIDGSLLGSMNGNSTNGIYVI